MSKIWSIIITIALAIICSVVYYLWLPAVNLASAGFWFFLLLCVVCLAISLTCFLYDIIDEDVKFIWLGVAAFVVVFIILGFISSMIFHSRKARDVADITTSEKTISEAFPDLTQKENLESLPLVDLDTAKMLGDKKIAGIDHASWYDVDDEYNLITYQGKYYRLSSINYGGLFKYNKAKDAGIPGYVLVEVTPKNGIVTQEATLVTLDQPIRYSPSAYWSYDLYRHLRGQYPTYIFDDSYLEIDENGTPYWVTGVKRRTAGVFGVKTITSFILTSAQTGESKEYQISEAPDWIDYVFSLQYLMQIAEWHYGYINGFWNESCSKTNVWRTSYFYRSSHNKSDTEAGKFANFYGYSSIVDGDGQVLLYTGLTAANNAESNLGWLTIDTSTGKMVQYNVIGAEESSAQAAVEQLVQAQRYEATFPLPANIGGYPSYIMCLKGKAGLTQGYGICNMDNYSIAVEADTLDQAIYQYLKKLGNDIPNPQFIATPTDSNEYEVITQSGIIEAIYTAEIDGTTQFYYVIDGKFYRAAITINQHQITYKVGDQVTFNYRSSDDGIGFVIEISLN